MDLIQRIKGGKFKKILSGMFRLELGRLPQIHDGTGHRRDESRQTREDESKMDPKPSAPVPIASQGLSCLPRDEERHQKNDGKREKDQELGFVPPLHKK